MDISVQDYQAIRKFLVETSGIELGENKQYLVQSRLSAVLKKFDLASFTELVQGLNSLKPMSQQLKAAVVDAMTTNETFWFRDPVQFNVLQEHVLPELLEHKQGSVKIWSAACSTGQEAYSISMCVERVIQTLGKPKNVQIIGTDISEAVLVQARRAVYSELTISRGLDHDYKAHFFSPVSDGYRLNPEISNRVKFQTFNLLKPFSVLGRFDVIFCRNVLIYFPNAVKVDILQRMADALEPGGYIFLSSTEAMPQALTQFESVRVAGARLYRKKQ